MAMMSRSGSERPLRVVIVTARDAGPAARLAHYLARTGRPRLTIVGAIVDRNDDGGRRRGRISAWRRHGGVGYVGWRLALHAAARINTAPASPRYARTLSSLGAEFCYPVVEVGSVNSVECRTALAAMHADMGLSVMNRIIDRETFIVPQLGFVNLHYGDIPNYRGLPPAFWELHDGAEQMGVSVHRVDEQLDHGELLGRAEVAVEASDDPARLFERALEVDGALVLNVLLDAQAGTSKSLSVDWACDQLRTVPSPKAIFKVRHRLRRGVGWNDYVRAPLAEIPIDSICADDESALSALRRPK